jgi:cobalt/nickel transport system permease protein
MRENVFCMPLFSGYLMVTRASQLQAMHLICNAAASVSLLYLFGMTTPMPQIITALQKLHLPQVMIELMFLIYRYLFLLFETLSQMQKAAASRLGYRTATASWRSAKRIAASLMLQSFAKANASFDAMEARCYQGTLCFLNRQQRITAGQILAVCGISVCFVGIWLSALRLGWNW